MRSNPIQDFRFFPWSMKHCTSYLVLVGPRNGFELWFQIELDISYLLIPLHPVRNRALTTSFHLLRFCVLGLASPKEIPYMRSSVSRLPLQVVVGCPCLSSFPWGFQSSVCLVMLVGSLRRVCPTHRHCRSLMTPKIGHCCVLLQSSSLEMVSRHLIRRIYRRQVLEFLV